MNDLLNHAWIKKMVHEPQIDELVQLDIVKNMAALVK